MKTPSLLLASLFLLTLSGCIIYVEKTSHTPLEHKQVTKTIDATSVHTLIAKVQSGELTIKGVKNQQQITLTANIYYHRNNPYSLALFKEEENAKVIAKFQHPNRSQPQPYIDLTLLVPAHLLLSIDDSAGDIHIRNMLSDINIDDGSGNITITAGHNIKINDGSGNIQISNSSGSHDIQDGSGDIHMQQIAGHLHINDGSGNINLNDINGDINISDGSGDIRVNRSKGQVTVKDGSGDIDIYHTYGLNIIAAGSGDINYQDIKGPITL